MSRYKNAKVIRRRGELCFEEIKYPEVPLSPTDIFVVTTDGDRLDLLAQQLYGNKNLWWILSITNINLSQNSLYVPIGTQLRVPINIQDIISNYNLVNNL